MVQREVEMVRETFSFCRRCAHRVEIGRVSVGASLTCPACGYVFPAAGRSQRVDGAGEGRREKSKQRIRHPLGLPQLCLFFLGAFRFPAYRGTLYHTVVLTMGTIAAVGAMRLAAWCASADNESVDKFTRVLLWNGLLLSGSFGTIATLAWGLVASAYGLTILRDTSEGGDVVENWPNVLALEGLGESAYVITSFLLCMLPGLLVRPWWHLAGVSGTLLIAGTESLLFPVCLLAMLTNGSPINPVSLAVWQSLRWAWQAWMLFYVLILMVAAVAIEAVSAALDCLDWTTGVIMAGIVITVFWMISFRLLGRLAWFCSRCGADDDQLDVLPVIGRRQQKRIRIPVDASRRH